MQPTVRRLAKKLAKDSNMVYIYITSKANYHAKTKYIFFKTK